MITNLPKEGTDDFVELASWQKQIIEERLDDYNKNSTAVIDFDKTLNDIEEGYLLS